MLLTHQLNQLYLTSNNFTTVLTKYYMFNILKNLRRQ